MIEEVHKMKEIYNAEILENKLIGRDIYDMRLSCKLAIMPIAGQFIAVYTDNPAMLLPRPLSVCEAHESSDVLRIIYRIAGGGTSHLSKAKAGDSLRILAPLGNGFAIDPARKSFAVIGGGIGTPPLLELVRSIRKTIPDALIDVFMGYRTADQVILKEDFAEYTNQARIHIATDDGSCGIKGNVMKFFDDNSRYDMVYSCGPYMMMKHVAKWAMERDIDCQVSLEERMACTIGACLACVAKIHVNGGRAARRVCKTGPVFNGRELVW